MKIVYVSNSIIPSRTANSIHVMKMCQAFSENGHKVILLAPKREAEYENNINDIYEYYGVNKSFEILKLNYGNTKYVKTIAYGYKAAKKIEELNPDLVYGRDIYGCYFSAKSYPTIFEAHSPMSNFINRFILNRLNIQKKYQKTVVISKALKGILLSEQKIEEERFLVAHDGADEVSDFDTILRPSKNIRIGYFGHLYKGRGIDIILYVAKKMVDIEFHIVGGKKEDIEYWKTQVNSKNVVFHGFVNPKDVYKYRNSCDILVAPYQKEVAVSGGSGNTSDFMSPLKVFEYMSSKKAIIISDLPVLREIFNEKNSILVNCESVDDWGNAIEKFRNPEIRRKLSKKAYEDFLVNYTWINRAKEILNAIQ